jgi:hypothetical protein
MREILVWLCIICILLVFGGMKLNWAEAQETAPIQKGISLDASQFIALPQLSIGLNWTYPFPSISVIAEEQPLKGRVQSAAEICLEPFSVSKLLESPPSPGSGTTCSGNSLALSQSEANFTLPSLKSGIYALSALDRNGSLLNSSYLLVNKMDPSMQLPESIPAGEPLQVKVESNLSLKDNQSLIYGAILMAEEDYENMSLSLTAEGAGQSYGARLNLGNRSEQLPPLSSFSMDLAMNLINLLPWDSAVALQESDEPEVELLLITDQSWPKGEYILSWAVYSRQSGLMAMKQNSVRVV